MDCKCGRALSPLLSEAMCIRHPFADFSEGYCASCSEDFDREIPDTEVNSFVAIMSPWVRRNENYAQYAQARGSEFEG